VYGFLSVFIKMIKDIQPQYISITFDTKAKVFRSDEYPEYKAGRTKQPDEFYQQFDILKQILTDFKIISLEKDGYEADDIIGTIAYQLSSLPTPPEIVIVTSDFDLLQLINQHVKVVLLKKGISETVVYDEDAMQEKYGFSPTEFVDFKALKGDASDNIPGVKGVGEKTAQELIKNFGSIERIYNQELDASTMDYDRPIPTRIQKLLWQYKNEAFLSKKLATIVRDVPIEFNIVTCSFKGFDISTVEKIFIKFGFRTLITRLG
jgi:DNA polymerase-1